MEYFASAGQGEVCVKGANVFQVRFFFRHNVRVQVFCCGSKEPHALEEIVTCRTYPVLNCVHSDFIILRLRAISRILRKRLKRSIATGGYIPVTLECGFQ
jgi:hypothetical protein